MQYSSDDRRYSVQFETIAIVDIGSNTVRLVVYEGNGRTSFPLFNEKINCGLGRSVTYDGSLPPAAVDRAIYALNRFRALCRRFQVRNIHVLATAAVRDARDGPQFIARAQDAIGVDVQLLTGKRESELALNAIHMGFANPYGICGDMGGGSLELVHIGDLSNKTVTLKLGGLKLIDRSKGRLKKAAHVIREDLSTVDWLSDRSQSSFYAIGGTWRALARLHMDYARAPLRIVQGYRVETSAMIAFCNLVLEKDKHVTELIDAVDVSRARRETLSFGALLMRELVTEMRPGNIRFSAYGIREGLLFSFLTEQQKQSDPLLAFCKDFARLRSRSYEYIFELCDWTDQVFNAAGISETKAGRRLRHAACMLSDTEWRAPRDHREELAFYSIAHAPAAGIDHMERLFLATAVYYCHTNKDTGRKSDPSGLLRGQISKKERARARRVAATVRTAHLLSAGLPGLLRDVSVTCSGGDTLILHLPRIHADFQGEQLEKQFLNMARKLEVEHSKIIVE